MSLPRVLVVEDSAEIRESLRDVLEFEGFDVRVAADGRAGLEAIDRDGPPDVLLLDLMMPVMDGWEVLAALRASQAPARARLPVIVVSGATDAEHVAHRYGCAALVKPVDIERLLDALRRCLGTA
ncbi:response regulator [Lysobacter xanthus]